LLDKVADNGIQSLSNAQRKKLEQLSQELYGRSGTANAGLNRSNK